LSRRPALAASWLIDEWPAPDLSPCQHRPQAPQPHPADSGPRLDVSLTKAG